MGEQLAGSAEPWSAAVRSLARRGDHAAALGVFRRRPPSCVLALALPAAALSCAFLSFPAGCVQLHCAAVKLGLLPAADAHLLSALITSYSRLGLHSDSHQLLDEIPLSPETPRSTLLTAHNAGISGHARAGLAAQANATFHRMHSAGITFDTVTLLALIPCAPFSRLPMYQGLALRAGLAGDTSVLNSLITAYARGAVSLACKVFDEIHCARRDVISWNSLLSAYAQNGMAREVLLLYQKMTDAGVKEDAVTCVAVLAACAHLGARAVGTQVEHIIVERMNKFHENVQLTNALINFHARTGNLSRAQELFDMMPRRSIVSWTALMTGYGIHGHGDRVVVLFEKMVALGVQPDGVVMVAVLSACSHAGLTAVGEKYFSAMEVEYKITRTVEHYACMVDLRGRAGQLGDALKLIQSMPMKADGAVWGALLGACKIHKNASIGEVAFYSVVELEPTNEGYYVLMSNIYSTAGKLDGVAKVRALMKEQGLKKTPGCSYVEHKGRVHLFMADDHSHPQAKQIYELVVKLEHLFKKIDRGEAFKEGLSIEVEMKPSVPLIGFHSEKLAVAFCLLNMEVGSDILVIKNLRVCEDCHTFLKNTSSFTGRTLLVRDATRFHCFNHGKCSCKEYW